MDTLTLLVFGAVLLGCICLHASILYALVIGFVIFCLYALRRGFSLREVASMCLNGIKTARNVLMTFLLIGMLTALWRLAGTIPVIVCYASVLIKPSLFLLMTFLLNCFVSVLTGTAFGTAATMGVVCATMGEAMQLSPVLIGGAVLSGAYFGDRCSPVSTSALLVAELTKTNIFDNIRQMLRTAAVPFVISCLIYALLGFFVPYTAVAFDLSQRFGQAFHLHWLALIPAILVLLLSAFRLSVKKTMLLSIVSASFVCLFLQGVSCRELLITAIFGYQTDNPEIAAMLNGGGIVSMLRVAAIVCISSAYSGIFQETGLLDGVQRAMKSVSRHVSSFGVMLITSILTGAVACNQTLTIMLTEQLCRELDPNRHSMAIDLENTAVVVAPLIPWSIAGGVSLSAVGAPSISILFACFLYLLPLWNLLVGMRGKPSPPRVQR